MMPAPRPPEKLQNALSLSLSLAAANFKMRNEGSYLGIFWYLLNPLALFSIILFVRRAAFAQNGIPLYPLYLLLGLIVFNFANQAIASAATVIDSNASIIKSIRIPKETFVISLVVQGIYSHLFELLLAAILMAIFGIPLYGLLFYPAILLFLAAFLLGASFLAATIGAYASDLKNIWSIASTLILFATPIFYAAAPGSAQYRINLGNPLFYFMTVTREVVLYRRLPSAGLLLATAAWSLATLAVGWIVFSKHKSRFAEII